MPLPPGTPLFKSNANFAPRVGASYQLRTNPGWETTLRGGAGLYYDLGLTLGVSLATRATRIGSQ